MLKYFNRLTCKYLMYNSTRVVKRGYQTNRTFFFGNSRILKYDDKWITLIQKFKGAIAKSRITVLKISRSRLMWWLKFTNPGLFLNFPIHGPKRGWIADHGKPLHHSSQVRTLNLKVRTTLSKKSTIIQYFNNYPELEPTKKNDGPKRRNILYTAAWLFEECQSHIQEDLGPILMTDAKETYELQDTRNHLKSISGFLQPCVRNVP